MDSDPYEKWLNIPSSRRPPSYYDLLGIAAEEHDKRRIEDTGADRYAHVRKYALGPQSDEAHRILNELSQAVICLSDPHKRKLYDRRRRPQRVEDWPMADREPIDFYELLAQPRFSPNRDGLLAAVAAARESLRVQDYDPDTQLRAQQLQRSLERAAAVLSRPSDYWEYHRKIIARLHKEYSQADAPLGRLWHPEHLRQWLQVYQSVHAARAEAVSRAMLADEAEARPLIVADLFTRRHATTAKSSELPAMDTIVQQAISAVSGQACRTGGETSDSPSKEAVPLLRRSSAGRIPQQKALLLRSSGTSAELGTVWPPPAYRQ